jgi:hypothetical protein
MLYRLYPRPLGVRVRRRRVVGGLNLVSSARFGQPERLEALAFGLATDSGGRLDASAAELMRLAKGDRNALTGALRRIEWRQLDRPSDLAEKAAELLRAALACVPWGRA